MSSLIATRLIAVSPLDGRYADKLESLTPLVSEYALIRYRLTVEVKWLLLLSESRIPSEIPKLDHAEKQQLQQWVDDFSLSDACVVKDIEQKTRHDVKAVEYFLQEKCKTHGKLAQLIPYIHFACTSEDINNLAYALMLKELRDAILIPHWQQHIEHLAGLAKQYAGLPMLARTHGQAASPTTLGKEFANVKARLQRQLQQLKHVALLGKINGATGNFNAHHAVSPHTDWMHISHTFVESLGLQGNTHTTQIEPHDYIAELLQVMSRYNTILIDFCRDCWGYISLGYFKQQNQANEVGSSTMPHKINPIDFENAEGNLGMANTLANHLANKLPLSRWQRDLTDSTVLRNLGTIYGYSVIAYQALQKGLSKISVDEAFVTEELSTHWEVLGEAIQTMMRRFGITDAYEQLKTFTRGKAINQQHLHAFIQQLSIPESAKQQLLELTPNTYIGLAAELAQQVDELA